MLLELDLIILVYSLLEPIADYHRLHRLGTGKIRRRTSHEEKRLLKTTPKQHEYSISAEEEQRRRYILFKQISFRRDGAPVGQTKKGSERA